MNKVILDHFIVVPTNYLIPYALCGSREIVVVTRYTIANFCVRRKEQFREKNDARHEATKA
jgi:hypothetical protein